MPPFAAKLNSKLCMKEQPRTDLGLQVWLSRHQATGGFLHWAFIVHNLAEDSYNKYELCRPSQGGPVRVLDFRHHCLKEKKGFEWIEFDRKHLEDKLFARLRRFWYRTNMCKRNA